MGGAAAPQLAPVSANSPNPAYIVTPPNPASLNPSDLSNPATPAAMALPLSGSAVPGDASTVPKFYTISASLRETYDDNVNTSNVNPKSSLETELSPSVLVDFRRADSDFSARYTLDITYYSVSPQGGTGGSLEYTDEFVAQYMHSFSSRFTLNLAEQFRYFTEPSLFESTGTAYRSGPYISNVINGTGSAQWTPLFGTTTNFANTIIRYQEAAEAVQQNSIENTGTQNFSFAILPKISVSAGGIVDSINYDQISRGYTSFTAYLGGQWEALPSLSINGQAGATYTETIQTQQSPGTFSPYAALSVSWSLGARSSLSFNYSHEITPSDEENANGQSSDRLTGNFKYDILTNLSAHLQVIFTNADVSGALVASSAATSYTEEQYGLDTGLTYHYDKYVDFDVGIDVSGVSSELQDRDYSRDEAYVGVRGTY